MIKRLKCGCVEINDKIELMCMAHSWEQLNLLQPTQTISKEEFISRWTESNREQAEARLTRTK